MDVYRGLEAAGDAAVDLRQLALRPVGRDHRGQVVVDLGVVAVTQRLPERVAQEDADILIPTTWR
ncbi:MAG TPA: hypothetical protein VL334_05620 [Anaerolineae bacterium]|nr:hypothetical protein [Anaerolineae bacterium]